MAPGVSQMVPRDSQMIPKWSQMIPKWSQMISKWSQMICSALTQVRFVGAGPLSGPAEKYTHKSGPLWGKKVLFFRFPLIKQRIIQYQYLSKHLNLARYTLPPHHYKQRPPPTCWRWPQDAHLYFLSQSFNCTKLVCSIENQSFIWGLIIASVRYDKGLLSIQK